MQKEEEEEVRDRHETPYQRHLMSDNDVEGGGGKAAPRR